MWLQCKWQRYSQKTIEKELMFMTTDYQPTRNNPYLLPKAVYRRTLWIIRDYERLKAERNELLYAQNYQQDGQPKGSGVGNPTENRALRLEQLSRDIEAVEQALQTVDEDMRSSIMSNICYRVPYPYYPGERTWQRAKQKFIHQVAKNAGLA